MRFSDQITCLLLFLSIISPLPGSSPQAETISIDQEHTLAITEIWLQEGFYYDVGTLCKDKLREFRGFRKNKSPNLYARWLNIMAQVYMVRGYLEKAEPLLVEASSIAETRLGKEDPTYILSLENLASLYHLEPVFTV